MEPPPSLCSDSGRIVWQFKTLGMVKSSPLVTSLGIFLGSYDKKLYRLTHKVPPQWTSSAHFHY